MIATRLDEIVRDYTHKSGDLREELGAERAHREMAEATLREGMAEEQRRREQAERERDDLRRELYALRQSRESPQTVEEEPEGKRSPTPLRGRLRRAHSAARSGGECSVAELLRSLISGSSVTFKTAMLIFLSSMAKSLSGALRL